MQYMWEFGDQSVPVIETPEEGVARAVATHVYADQRPLYHTATLTITVESDAGEIEIVSVGWRIRNGI